MLKAKMMKRKFLSTAMILSMALNTLTSNYCFAATTENSSLSEGIVLMNEYNSIIPKNEQQLIEVSKKQMPAIETNSKLIESLNKSTDSYDEDYPEYFAGTYLNEEKELVVCLTDNKQSTKDKITEVAGTSNVNFKIVEESYNELTELQDKLNKTYEESYKTYVINNSGSDTNIVEMLKSISGFSIISKTNCIEIGIQDITDKKLSAFQEIFGTSDNFKFVNKEQSKNCMTWAPGRAIYNTSSRCSTGYRAKYVTSSGSTYTGFTTCAHGGMTVGTAIYTNSSRTDKLGTVKLRQYSGSVDASFVTITKSNCSVGTTTYYGQGLSTSGGITIQSNTYYNSFVEDSCLYKSGSTTGTTSGTLRSANATVTIDGITFTNTIETSKFCEAGDSGGIVFYYNPSNGKSYACGLVKSSGSYSSNSIKASAVVSAMNVTPY